MLQSIKKGLVIAAASCMLMSCSTQPNRNPLDPLEPLNREIFGFNQTVDKALIRPVAYVYSEYLPSPFQTAIGNFFDNIRDVTNTANDLLQFKFDWAFNDGSRFLINSTIGILGIFDPASALGLEQHKQDFGQTLYHWGYKKSIYIVLPLLGPSTLRDAIGIGVDYEWLSVWPWIDNDWKKYVLLGLDGVDLRARVLAHETVLKTISIDNYSFFRSAYLQRRQYLFEGDLDKAEDAGSDTDPYEEEFGSADAPADADATKTEDKKEVKAQDKKEAKPQAKAEVKPQARAEVKPEAKQVVKDTGTKAATVLPVGEQVKTEVAKTPDTTVKPTTPQPMKVRANKSIPWALRKPSHIRH